MNVLKNWWLVIVSVMVTLLDAGFDVVNPVLIHLGLSETWINVIKALFLLGTIIKAKTETPTQNVEKLQTIVDNKKELLEKK